MKKGNGFLSFVKNIGRNIGKKISKNLSRNYSQNVIDHAKQSASDALKTASKIVIQKTAKATGYLIGNKLLIKLQKSWKIHQSVILTNILNIVEKYIEKDIYLQSKDRNLLMI